jgi:hypothetical protein
MLGTTTQGDTGPSHVYQVIPSACCKNNKIIVEFVYYNTEILEMLGNTGLILAVLIGDVGPGRT